MPKGSIYLANLMEYAIKYVAVHCLLYHFFTTIYIYIYIYMSLHELVYMRLIYTYVSIYMEREREYGKLE